MKTEIKKAQNFYSNPGINRVDTLIVKTDNGNYVYEHIVNGNSHQGTRVYNPQTNKDKLHENYAYLYYLKSIYDLEVRLIDKFITGKDIEKCYNNSILSSLPPINVHRCI